MGKTIALMCGLFWAGFCGAQSAILVDFAFDNRVPTTNSLPTFALQETRRRMIAGQSVPSADLRALADFGDGLAAYNFARRLQAGDPPAQPSVVAHYYAIAAYTGRAFAVPPLAAVLLQAGAEFSPSLLTQARDALVIQAKSGNVQAAQLLGQMYKNGQPFGYDTEKALQYLTLAGMGGGQAALDLGIMLMSDPADAARGHAGAKAALTLAAQGENLGARVAAQNLLARINQSISKAAP